VLTLDPAILFVGLIASGAGFILFSYGRKPLRPPFVIGGIALMLYPYFASTVTQLVAGAAVIAAGIWLAIRWGW
jgi:hypothetical protein